MFNSPNATVSSPCSQEGVSWVCGMAHFLCAHDWHRHSQGQSSVTAACALKHKLFHSENCLEILNCFFHPLGWKLLYQCIIINDSKLFLRQWGCFTSYGVKWASTFPGVHPIWNTSRKGLQDSLMFQCHAHGLLAEMATEDALKRRCAVCWGHAPSGRTSASPVAHWSSLLGAGCTNSLFERLSEVLACGWNISMVCFSGMPSSCSELASCLPTPLPVRGPAVLPRSLAPLGGGGLGNDYRSHFSNFITDFRQHFCLMLLLKCSSSLLQIWAKK